MSYVRMSPRAELSEYYPPPYNFLAPKRSKGMGQTSSSSSSSSSSSGLTPGNIIAGVTDILEITSLIEKAFQGCGSSCTLTSTEANNIESMMQQNLSQYLAAPVSAATQAEALGNFNTLWSQIQSYCLQPSLGAAGTNCISERQNGACSYKTTPGGWQQNGSTWTYVYPGANGSGSTCWNWFVGYSDPITNDPRIGEASSTSSSSASSSSGASILFPAALIGGGLLLLFMFGDL
jgi:hypothetical protein